MKKIVRPTLLVIAVIALSYTQAMAQGCVAIRQMGGCGSSSSGSLSNGEWQVGANYRYFRSFRHYKGKAEQVERLEQHTEVINLSHSLDLNVAYALNNRLSFNASVPLVYNDRSSLYEHDRINRFHTYSSGLGDVRVGASYWVLNPSKQPKGNAAVGLGVKLPTGDYKATDEFHTIENGPTTVKPVDQSIQPGDGGLGFTLDLQGYYSIIPALSFYANGFYLVNPRESNGTATGRSPAYQATMSVPDQYLVRGGFSWLSPLHGFSVSIGTRFEGVPVEDLIGGSEGFRRPGYVWSVEPGLNYITPRASFFITVPYALQRNRTQSVPDKLTEAATGMPRHGDAAFADYSINVGAAWRFGGHKANAADVPKWDDAKN